MPNNVSCSAFGQTAMAPDYSTCQAFQFSYGIQFLKIEFFCFVVSATVILISLFGKIKESYKWFILNQAIWDLVVEYDYVCNKPAYWTEMDNFNPAILKPPSTCIYYVDRFASNYLIGIRDAVTYLINFLPLSMLFLLSLSRFLAIFKHDFYKRHDSWIKILIVIVFSNLASAFLISFYTLRLRFIAGYCQDLYCIGTTRTGFKCDDNHTNCMNSITIFIYELNFIFQNSHAIFVTLWMLLSIIFTLLSFIKIGSHFLSSSQINASRLLGSLRVTSVLLFQCFTATVFLFLSAYYDTLYTAIPAAVLHYTNETFQPLQPSWYLLLNRNYKSINMLRILLDSVIVLSLLSGYRQGLSKFFKFFFKLIPTIKKRFWNGNTSSQVTVSLFRARN